MAADTKTSKHKVSQTGGTIPLKYPGRKLLTTLLAVLVALSMLPMAALASIQPAYAEGTGSVTVTVAAVDNNTNSFVLLPTEVTVPAGKAAEYGYANCAPGTMVGGEDFGIAAGQVSTLDALLAAHELKFGAGFNPNTYLIGDSAYFTGMFGLGAGGYTFTVNGKTPIGNYSNGYGINQYPLTDGELVVFIKGSDETGGMDGAAFFSELQKSVTTGEQFTLTLLGFDPLDALWANPGDPTRPLNSEPVEGATLKLADPATGSLSSLGVTTDSNGQATLSFSTPGTYVVSATGEIEVFSMLTWDFEYVTFGVPVCIVTVNEETTDPEGVCSIADEVFSTLEDALAAAQNGDCLKLLADINYNDHIYLSAINLTLDVNGFTLNVVSPSTVTNYDALEVHGCTLNLIDTSDSCDGQFNVTALGLGAFGVGAYDGGSVAVTNATGSYGAYASSAYNWTGPLSSVTVLGNATASNRPGSTTYAVYASRANILVLGDVVNNGTASTAYGVYASGLSSVIVAGSINVAPTASAVYASYATGGASVMVNGSINTTGVYARIMSTNKLPSDGVPSATKAGYLDYTDNNSHVLVRNPGYTVEKTALAIAIRTASAFNGAIYSEASWLALTTALAAAKATDADVSASQGDVDTATVALYAAIESLDITNPDTYVRVTKGATVGVYLKGSYHFTEFASFPLTLMPERSDALYDYYMVDLPVNSSLMYHIEAYIPGETAKMIRQFIVASKGQVYTLDLTPISEWVEQDNGIYAANMYTNLPATGSLDLNVGESFDLDLFRISQGQISPTGYDFYEPCFTLILSGSIDMNPQTIGSTGRKQVRITPASAGLGVLIVYYDPLEVYDTSGNVIYRFNGTDACSIGAVVVNAGGGEAFDTGITADCDFDTFYFDSTVGYKEFSFTPAAGTTVRVHDAQNSNTRWNEAGAWTSYTAAEDGSYTVRLTEGRNIIELKNGDSVRYQVLRAKGVTVTVSNATNPGEPFAVGDTVSIKMSSLEDTIEKMSGIYNPGFNGGQFIRYSDGESNYDSTRARQWSSLTTEFSVSYTITRTGDITLTGICSINMMAYTGRTPGWHRNIPLTGLISAPDGLAVGMGPFYYSSLPEITISVAGTDDPGALAAAKLAKAAEVNAVLDGLVQADYTVASWAALATAIASALAEVDAATTVGEVEAVVVPDASSILVVRPAYGDAGSGDLNGDGIVDMSEALRVAQVVVGGGIPLSPGQFAAMDMDFDGLLTMADVVLVMRRAAGL